MNVKIREAKREDYSGIATISKEDLGYECAAELVKRQLEKVIADEGSKVFVAEQDGEIVGYIHVADYNTLYFEPIKNVMGLAVRKKFRRLGVGAKLLREAEKWAVQCGSAVMRLNSGMSRPDAHGFYRRQGYGNEKEQMRFMKQIR